MLTLAGYTNNQIQVLINFGCLKAFHYNLRPETVSLAKEYDYPIVREGEEEIRNLMVKEGVFNDFLYRLVKEYTGTPENFESFLKQHLDSVYRAVCAASAKEKIRKLLEEARGLADHYDLNDFYVDNR